MASGVKSHAADERFVRYFQSLLGPLTLKDQEPRLGELRQHAIQGRGLGLLRWAELAQGHPAAGPRVGAVSWADQPDQQPPRRELLRRAELVE